MTAELIYQIVVHLPEKEMEKLYHMLGKKVLPEISHSKNKKIQLVSDQEAIQYLLKNVFCKKRE